MSYNGNGVFVINTAGQPVVTGTTISSTTFNNLTADLATGLTTALTKDGQSTPTANIGMGAFKITNLAAGTVASDAARLDQVQGGSATFITAAGTDTITGTTSPALTAYATGNQFSFVVANTNTGAVTINVDGLGAKAITRTGTTALVAGDMVAGQAVEIIYDGTRFQLVNGNSFTNLKVSGTLGVTGVSTFTAQPIVSSLTASLPIFTDGSKGLVSNTMTGTGNVVMSTSPTLVTPVLGAATATTLAVSDSINTPNTFGFKNRIINGGMVIDQRNAGASVTTPTTGTGVYTLDRWLYLVNAANKMTIQQNAGSVTPPVGFSNYLGITSTSAYTVGAGEQFCIQQNIEGFNTADLGWGTADAKTVTLSFWVRSSLTGTFSIVLKNSAANRSYPASYTITSANTWELKSITVAGDTSGTWVGATNGIGLRLYVSVGCGATLAGTSGAWAGADYYGTTGTTSVVGTNGATFYITGVQLEKGSTATSFDFRAYSTELAMCQRYYQSILKGTNLPISIAAYVTATRIDMVVPLKVSMRAAPSMVIATGASYYDIYRAGADDFVSSFDLTDVTTEFVALRNTTEVSGTAGQAGYVLSTDASASIAFSSEL